MSPEEKKLLEEAVGLSRENNKMLHRLQSAMRWGRFYSILKWVIIVGFTFGVYYYLQPYLIGLIDAYQAVSEGLDEVREAGSNLPDFSGLLDRFGQ